MNPRCSTTAALHLSHCRIDFFVRIQIRTVCFSVLYQDTCPGLYQDTCHWSPTPICKDFCVRDPHKRRHKKYIKRLYFSKIFKDYISASYSSQIPIFIHIPLGWQTHVPRYNASRGQFHRGNTFIEGQVSTMGSYGF